MSWFWIFGKALLAVLFFTVFQRMLFPKRDRQPAKGPEDLPGWVEIINMDHQPLVAGRVLTWLPSPEFEDGAALLLGVLNLDAVGQDVREAIETHCHPARLDGSFVFARIMTRASTEEPLIVGPLDDDAMQERIERTAPSADDIEVLLELTSASIKLMDTEDSRGQFLRIWGQYAPASLPIPASDAEVTGV